MVLTFDGLSRCQVSEPAPQNWSLRCRLEVRIPRREGGVDWEGSQRGVGRGEGDVEGHVRKPELRDVPVCLLDTQSRSQCRLR